MIWQCTLNLLGKSQNTVTLTGIAMDETDDKFEKTPYKQVVATFRSYLYAIFGAFDLGAQDAIQRGDEFNKAFAGWLSGLEPFYRGVSLFAMARRRTGGSSYKTAATKILKQLRVWLKKGCVNLEGCVCLLSAEDAALQGKKGKVCKTLYEEAISSSVRGGFYQNAALACERYADYLLNEEHDTDGADSLLFQAIDYYSRWGAAKKVEILQERLRGSVLYGESLSSKLLTC